MKRHIKLEHWAIKSDQNAVCGTKYPNGQRVTARLEAKQFRLMSDDVQCSKCRKILDQRNPT